ncbi:hypothetical protein MMC07_006693 [Pseudocyphellaria aurata]|nr:hypothetical protein [Pseudocyphellaria aurata]
MNAGLNVYANPVCPDTNTGIGLRYGYCYTMKDTSQRQIQRYDTKYIMDSTRYDGFKGLVFRICKSTHNCWSDYGHYVPLDGAWYQLDQLGWRDAATSGWLGHSGYEWYLTDIKNADNLALKFNGTAVNIFGECAICLRLAEKAYGDWMGTANYAGGDVLTLSLNPVSCRQFYYQQTTCLKEAGVDWK